MHTRTHFVGKSCSHPPSPRCIGRVAVYVCTPLSLLQGDSIDFVPFKKLPNLLNELLQKLVTLDFNAKELLMLKSLRAKVANFFFQRIESLCFKGYYKMHLGHRRRDDAILLFYRQLLC